MCGIFGVIDLNAKSHEYAEIVKNLESLFKLSESRGKEASGLAMFNDISEDIFVIKSQESASKLIKSNTYRSLLSQQLKKCSAKNSKSVFFGHTRLVTNGSLQDNINNQPITYKNVVIIHNGIIVNDEELWAEHPDLSRKSQVDTEILAALIDKYLTEGAAPENAVAKAFSKIKGTASVILSLANLNLIIAATNNGSLYSSRSENNSQILFASEAFILKQFLKTNTNFKMKVHKFGQITAGTGCIIDLSKKEVNHFEINDIKSEQKNTHKKLQRRITEHEIQSKNFKPKSVYDIQKVTVPKKYERYFECATEKSQKLQRCVHCILPETVPFIIFDAKGVCNFCNNYKPIKLLGKNALANRLEPFKKSKGNADCLLALSGGRDSCYGLHLLTKEYGMKPLTYTYDWGLVTDLARRNIARMCGQLGVENIIVSADIATKRKNVSKNVKAWLNKPHLGMIPLFMAGDKQFIHYAQKVREQAGLELEIFSFNLLEKTQFKEEFSGIQFWQPGTDADKFGEQMNYWQRAKLVYFYGSQFLTNTGYLNSSLFDTAHAFFAYYFTSQNFIPMFNYVPWIENDVNDLLINEYDWEQATDTASTWRIGDGTASFYNYIYFVIAGFTENDTMRSNQVREGHLSREEALVLAQQDNQPRWDTLKWYCDVIDLDMFKTLEVINDIPKINPKLYQ